MALIGFLNKCTDNHLSFSLRLPYHTPSSLKHCGDVFMSAHQKHECMCFLISQECAGGS